MRSIPARRAVVSTGSIWSAPTGVVAPDSASERSTPSSSRTWLRASRAVPAMESNSAWTAGVTPWSR
ncbi:hypothetical protein [Corynebacterium variabile]